MKNNSHNDKKTQRLVERMTRKIETDKSIIDALEKEDDLTIAELVDKLKMSRGNLAHYLNDLVKRRIVIKKRQKNIHGQPTFLRVNKKFLKARKKDAIYNKKSFEEKMLRGLLAEKVLKDIDEKQPSEKQYQKLIKMFKDFGRDSYGEKILFFLHSDYIKVNYTLSLTDKGERALRKIDRKKKLNS